MSTTLLRAMARNYANGHCWDHLDGEACLKAADRIEQLEAELANIKEIEFPKRVEKVAESWRGKCERLETENAALREGFGEPVAWEWKRTHLAGGYTRQVTISEQQAIEWAADSSNLHEKDTVTPLYARKDKS